MKHDLADKWGERLRILDAQLERESAGAMLWCERGEARVLRFLLRRYGEDATGQVEAFEPAETIGAADAATPPQSVLELELAPTAALERSLLRLALRIPGVTSKRLRPAPPDRAAILERIRIARDQGRAIEAEELWRDETNGQARRNALRLRECEEQWKRRAREQREEEERERRWRR